MVLTPAASTGMTVCAALEHQRTTIRKNKKRHCQVV